MKRFRKLASVTMALTLTAAMSASMACTVVAVGKDASVDGSTMVTHSCDGWYDHRVQVIPGGKHAAGEAVEIYRDPCMDTMETPIKVGEIPQVEETNTYFNVAYPFMNDKGIAVGEHTWSGREDVFNGEGLFVIANLEMLGLQRADTAREMVQVVGALAEEYGYCDWGESIIIADPQEVWVFEICGPGATWTKDSGAPGAHWAARRVPDNEIYAAANRSRMGVIDFNDTENYMWSTDITKLPEMMGWWKEGEEFDFSKIFDDPGTGFGCGRREWRVFNLLAPNVELPSTNDDSMPYPFTVAPAEKITMQDLMEVYEDHYEGTQYDMTQGLAAGPFGNPCMYRVKGDQKPEDVKQYNWERSIGIYRCSYSFVAQCRDWMPAEVGTVLWYGADDPTTTCRVPIYAGTNTVPVEWSTGDRYNFDPDCAWWAFNFLGNWAGLRWDMMFEDINAKRDELQGEMFANQEAFEAEAIAKLEADNAAGREFITQYVCDNMDHVNDEWWKFAFEMVGKYADGQVVTADGYTSPGYPTEFLEAVGFGQTALADAKLNAGETVEPEAPEATVAPEATTAPEATEAPAETAAPETAAPETAAPEAPAEESGSNTGMIVGIIVAIVVVVAAIYFFTKKKGDKK